MGIQVCFTADSNLVAAVDEIAAKIGRSRSDVVATLVWLAIQNMKAQPRDFGELIRSVSAGTGIIMPTSFNVEKEFTVSKQETRARY